MARWWIKGRRLRKAVDAADAVAGFLRSLPGGGQRAGELEFAALWRNWPAVLGPELAALARPLGRSGSTLLLGMDDPIVAQELSFFAPQILERANGALGRKVFDKVHFDLLHGRIPLDAPPQGPMPPAAPAPMPRPHALGGLERGLAEDSAPARAYRAYLRLFQR